MTTMNPFWLLVVSYNLIGSLAQDVRVPCNFCPRGEITEPSKPVVIPDLEILDTCGALDMALEGIFAAGDAECKQLEDLFGSYCGCPLRENACSLCSDGSPVPDEYREKELAWLAQAFGGTAPTCGFLEAFMTSYESGDEGCSSLQIINAACGCPALPDHCKYCPGETLQEEYYDKELPFVSNEALGVVGTCELYWYTQYQIPESHLQCAQSSVLTFHCGCNNGLLGSWGSTTETQQIAMSWVPRVVGLFSLIAASLVLFDILRDKKKRLSVYHQLIVLIVIFDIVTALVFIVGAAAVQRMNPETGLPFGVYGAYGNEASCKASGFFYHLGFTSVFLNVSLSAYFLLVIVHGLREEKLRKLRVWLFVPPLLLGFGLSFAAIPFVQISWNHCQADSNPWGETLWSLLVFHFIPLLGSTLIILVLLLLIYLNVRLQLQKTKKSRFEARDGSSEMITRAPGSTSRRRSSIKQAERKDSLEREVFWVCVSYAMAFGITWPIIMIGQFQGVNFDYPFWFWVVVVIVSPAQGISNAYCYFRPQIQKRRRRRRRRRHLAENSSDDEELRNQESQQRNCFFVYCGLSSKRPTDRTTTSNEGRWPDRRTCQSTQRASHGTSDKR